MWLKREDDKYIEIQNTYVLTIIWYILIYLQRYYKEDLYIYIYIYIYYIYIYTFMILYRYTYMLIKESVYNMLFFTHNYGNIKHRVLRVKESKDEW